MKKILNRVKKQQVANRNSGNIELLFLCIPAMLVVFVFSYIPMFGMILAFKNYRYDKGFLGSSWSGLENFRFFFESQDAWKVLRNTLGYNFSFIIIGILVSVVLSLLLYEVSRKIFIKVYQTMMFMPFFLSFVVVSYALFSFLNVNLGIINSFLQKNGIGPVSWYSEPVYWPAILLITYIWKYAGYNCVIYYAGLLSINVEYFEAASIDGATKLQTIKNISIPFLKPLIIVMFLLQVGKIFYSDFGMFYFLPMRSGILNNVTDVIDTYVFRAVRVTGDIGMSSAINFFQSVMGFVAICLANYIIKKRSDSEYGLF